MQDNKGALLSLRPYARSKRQGARDPSCGKDPEGRRMLGQRRAEEEPHHLGSSRAFANPGMAPPLLPAPVS